MAPNPGLPKACRCQNLVLTVTIAVILFRGRVSSEHWEGRKVALFEPLGIDDPQAPWNRNPVDRGTASLESGCVLILYQDHGQWMSHEELVEAVSEEAAAIPPEEAGWIDGEFNAEEYIIEACISGMYGQMEVTARIVTEYTDGTHRWTTEDLRAKARQQKRQGDLGFDAWLTASLTAGDLRAVEFLQYIGQDFDGGDKPAEYVVMERRIVG